MNWQPFENVPANVPLLLTRDGQLGCGMIQRGNFDGVEFESLKACWFNNRVGLSMALNDESTPDAWMLAPDPAVAKADLETVRAADHFLSDEAADRRDPPVVVPRT